MKKIFLIALYLMAFVVAAFAQVSSGNDRDGSPGNTVKSVTFVATEDTMQLSVNKSADAAVTTIQVMTDNEGKPYVIYKGTAYQVADAGESLSEMSQNISDIRAAMVPHQRRDDARWKQMLVVFGIPCLTIAVALVLLLVFLIKKNRTRTEIITRAIENHYELPESFYTGQPSANCLYGPATGQGSEASDHQGTTLQPVSASMRDPRKFSSAMTTIAVGLALLLFFVINVNWGIGFLIGGIPLFIGVGKLLSYLYVPTVTRNPGPMDPRYLGNGHYGPQQPPYQRDSRSYYGPQQPRERGDDCPPPFPGENIRL